ncbi:glycosyltransferase [Rhodococcoides trifolii]|uniref:glycosyltransferase n=1 Tax=Rhodococcoides trifolii TaxID=908250 RepID=UPI001663684D|nr:glycosyltransferase [Rhodococcus trifolii]
MAIIHPWLPQYRVPFFDLLGQVLRDRDVDLKVFVGDTPPEWKARNDSSTSQHAKLLPTRFIKVGDRVLTYKSLATLRQSKPYDLLVLEQAIRNLETYQLIAPPRLFTRIAYWGHGRTYTAAPHKIEEAIKMRMTLSADWFFGYTDQGVEHVVNQGFPRQRTTTVQNSIDTKRMQSDLDSVTEPELKEFKLQHDLTSATALYIGGVDESKRIDFLLESGRRIFDQNPNFRLIIAGSGSDSHKVAARAKIDTWIKPVGPVFGLQKALAFRSSKVLMIPGRVGLVAVDSLTAGLPIITTDWPFHAPEFEYLEKDSTCVVSPDDMALYSVIVAQTMANSRALNEMADKCRIEARKYTVEAMVTRFADGIHSALS